MTSEATASSRSAGRSGGRHGRGTTTALATAAGLALALGLGGCATTTSATSTGSATVAPSVLDAAPVRTPPGPAYVTEPVLGGPGWEVVVGDRSTPLGQVDSVDWLPDGRLLVSVGSRARLVDPTTGETIREVPSSEQPEVGVTPEAVTAISPVGGLAGSGFPTVDVYSLDLTEHATIEVDPSALDTDQLASDTATLSLFGTPYTLGGATWVQWGVSDEYGDEDADGGVLRIEDGEPVEVLGDEPVVSLAPSRDGAALLVLEEDRIVELDPATGEVDGDYGLPPGAEPGAVEALDKIGGRVVTRFSVNEPDRPSDPDVTRETWSYDGDWTRLDELGAARTYVQDGGTLAWTQLQTGFDATEGAAFRLEWVPVAGTPQVLVDGPATCPPNPDSPRPGATACPLVRAPGSMLPPG